MDSIYADIAKRTGGNIYIGVVGPVRTGKSSFIKRIMEQVVIPKIHDPYEAERARDELPQSGSGRTIMTSEPKFVPEDGVEIQPDGKTFFRIRMIDSVGYMVKGAVGVEENGEPRMVTTPWFDHEIPMTEAAELGTKKVMEDHCSIGIVVTTDGSITDIPREDYVEAEHKAISDMIATGKPFLTIINTKDPKGKAAEALKKEMKDKFDLEAVVMDCQAIDEDDIGNIFQKILFQFPLGQINVYLPQWLEGLDEKDPLKAEIWDTLYKAASTVNNLDELENRLLLLYDNDKISKYEVSQTDLGNGTINLIISMPNDLFYKKISEKTELDIKSDADLLLVLTELSNIRKEYTAIEDALNSVKTTGYGIVMPEQQDMLLQKPETIKKGGAFGVKIKAKASSIHMIRVDIDTEVSPMVGDESQSKALIHHLGEQSTENLWDSNIFGRSVYELIQDGFHTKLMQIPLDVRGKFQGCLTKIVNDGATGLICIIL